LPVDAPFVLAPAALTFGPAIADDRVPVSIGFFLILGRDLERESFALPENRPAVQADARHAADGEFDNHHVARPIAWGVHRSAMNGADAAIGKGPRVEIRGLLGVLVIPDADRVLGGRHFRLSSINFMSMALAAL
jgi:hypothetical protein